MRVVSVVCWLVRAEVADGACWMVVGLACGEVVR